MPPLSPFTPLLPYLQAPGPCGLPKVLYNLPAMKTGIHPEMHAKAKTTCMNCKAVFEIPSTVEEQQVEICRNCHPVYTGKQATEVRGGRIDRFRKRMSAKPTN